MLYNIITLLLSMREMLPKSLEHELHPLCNRQTCAKILKEVQSNPAVCIQEIVRTVGCSSITARKNLVRLVKAGLAIEKRIGKARVFIGKDSPRSGTR
jgi:predicted transcriptional regulator